MTCEDCKGEGRIIVGCAMTHALTMPCGKCGGTGHKPDLIASLPVAGHCVDIDGASWHKDGDRCQRCGFGINDFGDGIGAWGEPVIPKPSPSP